MCPDQGKPLEDFLGYTHFCDGGCLGKQEHIVTVKRSWWLRLLIWLGLFRPYQIKFTKLQAPRIVSDYPALDLRKVVADSSMKDPIP